MSATYNAVTGTTDVTDKIGHGTFVAGVAAATGDNGIGIAGASMGASVMAVKVADANGYIYTDAVAAGVRWAADHGAKVINLSLGSGDRPARKRRDRVRHRQGCPRRRRSWQRRHDHPDLPRGAAERHRCWCHGRRRSPCVVLAVRLVGDGCRTGHRHHRHHTLRGKCVLRAGIRRRRRHLLLLPARRRRSSTAVVRRQGPSAPPRCALRSWQPPTDTPASGSARGRSTSARRTTR